jgi:hypothetical protein
VSAHQSQAGRITALENRLASVDAKFAAIFAIMAEATEAAGIGTGGDPDSHIAEARAQVLRAQIHLVRTEAGQ